MKLSDNQTIIFGPPGCGKTTTLLSIMEKHLNEGTDPNRVSFVSFTRKAVAEAKDRAISKFNFTDNDLPYFRTIHSLCFSVLGIDRKQIVDKVAMAEFGQWIGYRFTGAFDESETGMPAGSEPGDKLLFHENMARVQQRSLQEYWKDSNPGISFQELERFATGYRKYKDHSGLLDFTDLLEIYVRQGASLDIDVAIVDEAQDLSSLQWSVIRRAFGGVHKMYIAGDDDQSIYKWSGADTKTFLELEGQRMILSQSYRLPKRILTFSNQIVKHITPRVKKDFKPQDREGSVSYVPFFEEMKFNPEETTLILARNVYLLAPLYARLRALGLAYKGRNGYSSVHAPHVSAIKGWELIRKGEMVSGKLTKDVYEQLRVGEYLARGNKVKIANIKDRDELSYETLKEHFGLQKLAPWWDALQGISLEHKTYYRTLLRSGYKLSNHENIQVNTIHGVKGSEADNVIVLSDMSSRTFEEYQSSSADEHRVSYVAATRTKQRLTIVQPQTNKFYPYQLICGV